MGICLVCGRVFLLTAGIKRSPCCNGYFDYYNENYEICDNSAQEDKTSCE